MNKIINPLQIAQSLSNVWSPKILSEVNNSYIKVAKLQGEFVWHTHINEDEMFMVLEGQLIIEFRDKQVELNKGDFYVVPKGVEHNPVAKNECLIMLIELKTTSHTGDTPHPNSKSIQQQLI
ncbi:MAG: cupin domain-containing protein [Alcanivoracaceae bacterium]|nr:cupin domain-containing protein [Alcanivoracaceae bacterium]